MGAHRRIHTRRRQGRQLPTRFVVQQLAHAMQPLQLEPAAGAQRRHARQRVGVVRGKQRLQRTFVAQEAGGASEVRKIRRGLAREHRIVVEAALLGALHLRVPIRALHQPHHEAPAGGAGQRGQPVNDGRGTFRIRLHCQP